MKPAYSGFLPQALCLLYAAFSNQIVLLALLRSSAAQQDNGEIKYNDEPNEYDPNGHRQLWAGRASV